MVGKQVRHGIFNSLQVYPAVLAPEPGAATNVCKSSLAFKRRTADKHQRKACTYPLQQSRRRLTTIATHLDLMMSHGSGDVGGGANFFK